MYLLTTVCTITLHQRIWNGYNRTYQARLHWNAQGAFINVPSNNGVYNNLTSTYMERLQQNILGTLTIALLGNGDKCTS